MTNEIHSVGEDDGGRANERNFKGVKLFMYLRTSLKVFWMSAHNYYFGT